MKIIIVILTFLLISPNLIAMPDDDNTKAQKVYSIVKSKQSVEWYTQQAKLWGDILDKEPKNSDAWLNFYTANRMAKILGQPIADLNAIVDQMEQLIPDSYEFNLIKYWHGGNNLELFPYLKKAYEIDPNRPETYSDFITYYELKRNQEKVKEFAQKWFESNEISPNIMAWNYNVLMSLDPNAIILTAGDNDTYPLWIWQYVHNIRPDVTVMNTSLAIDNNYRNALLNEIGIESFNNGLDVLKDFQKFNIQLAQHLVDKAVDKPVYLGVSTPTFLRSAFEESLYVVGLALKHTDQRIDNVAILKNNYENHFLTDYLKADTQFDISAGIVDHMNLNYIPAFTILYDHYEASGEDKKSADVRQLALRIAQKGGREDAFQNMLIAQSNKDQTKIFMLPDAKKYHKNFEAIKGNLHASSTEVSNKEYELFIQDLLTRRDYEKLDECRPEITDWIGLLDKKHQSISDDKLYKVGRPDGENAPIQNISHQAAILYCEWLTDAYNRNDKRKYQEVKFRLPTKEEWTTAANGGRNNVKYPWGGPLNKNAKGCYLNSCYPPEDPGADGGYFTVNVSSYFPNDLGLYNTVGNVAEMVQEKGLALGGSWLDKPEDTQISSISNYNGPSPKVGFRVFMEIIRE